MNEQRKVLSVGLAGFGVVGSGLCQLLQENADIIHSRAGCEIFVKTILVRDAQKKRSVSPPPGAKIVTSPRALIDDPQIDVLVELMGGTEAAGDLIRQALKHGKHVVTANKALLAEAGTELFKTAETNNLVLRYEASVAGAIPIISTLRDSLAGNRIKSIIGILNGTSNYILSEMSASGIDFDVALSRAQTLGYAEADPSLDIDGLDAAHKLIVLIRLAFGMQYPLSSLDIQGIRNLSSLDIRLAREFGYRIKLIGHARALDSDGQLRLAAGVFPALTPHNSLLARVSGSYNALHVEGNASGPLFFHGRGAGSLPTAGAVLADLIAVGRNENPRNTGYALPIAQADILPPDDWRSCYYLRVMAADEPGVLRDISGCLAAEGISVAQMIQRSSLGADEVPLVFMTHECAHSSMKNAMKSASRLLREPAVFFRVLDKE